MWVWIETELMGAITSLNHKHLPGAGKHKAWCGSRRRGVWGRLSNRG
ncbi:hypothetical protein E2C01_101282 [Portunus trituberculatus]|uniref:Uncharacterized protein n=1 Tax=Portunus trituberculatus TaxID=210409 RepID=A0A5B7KFF8_PORTR|nr:hypothetical protein [Portunus trituberculatus]